MKYLFLPLTVSLSLIYTVKDFKLFQRFLKWATASRRPLSKTFWPSSTPGPGDSPSTTSSSLVSRSRGSPVRYDTVLTLWTTKLQWRSHFTRVLFGKFKCYKSPRMRDYLIALKKFNSIIHFCIKSNWTNLRSTNLITFVFI